LHCNAISNSKIEISVIAKQIPTCINCITYQKNFDPESWTNFLYTLLCCFIFGILNYIIFGIPKINQGVKKKKLTIRVKHIIFFFTTHNEELMIRKLS